MYNPKFIQVILPDINDRHHKITAVSYDNHCWICNSHARTKEGYARIRYNGIDTVIHKVIYQILFGIVPPGFQVRHLCGNSSCINPFHLDIGTPQENSDDKFNHGTIHSKLKESEVLEILQSKSATPKELAQEYSVSITTVRNILVGKTWKHLFSKVKSTLLTIKSNSIPEGSKEENQQAA